MTREEIKKAMRDTKKEIVLKNLNKLLSLVEGYPEYEDCISYAIEELEQEPILDKIRAEISTVYESLDGYDPDSLGAFISKIDEIFDKYKAETEAER